ncbi:MAG: tetratricopeptide repeat protein [Vulcanimicrobiaceae bacterium]
MAAVCVAAAFATLNAGRSPAAAQAGDKAAAVRHYLAGSDAAGAGHRDAAVHEFLAGEAADPAYALNYFALADLDVQARDYPAAQAQLQRLIALNPSTPYAHYYLALVLEAQHQNNLALKNLNVELQLDPAYAPAKRARTEVLAVLGETPAQTTAAPASSPAVRPTLHATVKVVPRASAQPSPKPTFTNFPVPTPRPTATPLPTPSPTATPTPFVLTSVMTADAKGYLLEVARDVAFTQALPPVAPQDPQSVERAIDGNLGHRGSYDALLSNGTLALKAGRTQLARQAFESASEKDPTDWRAPYLEGLAAQADGDLQPARSLLLVALGRAKRPEILTSLAIVDVRMNDLARASSEAQNAANLDAAYLPAQFTAGQIDLANGDAATAARRLQATVALGHAPERTPFFLDLAQRALK